MNNMDKEKIQIDLYQGKYPRLILTSSETDFCMNVDPDTCNGDVEALRDYYVERYREFHEYYNS